MKLSVSNNMSQVEVIEVAGMQELALRLKSHTLCPAVFAGNRRLKANFVQSELVALDIENGIGLEELKAKLDCFGVQYILGTTRNHMLEKNGKAAIPRMRAILALSRPVVGVEEFDKLMRAIQIRFPENDRATLDAAHMFFPCSEIVHVKTEGHPLDVDQFLLEFAPKGNLALTTRDFVENGAKPGTFNSSLYKASKDVQQNKYSLNQAVALFGNMENQYYSGELDNNDIRTIESAYSTAPKYPPRFAQYEQVLSLPDRIASLIFEMYGQLPRLNVLKNHIEIVGRPIEDSDLAKIRNEAKRRKFGGVTKDNLFDVIQEYAVRNSYHPLKEFIELNSWNSDDHISDLFQTLSLKDDFLQYEVALGAIFKKFLVNLVKKTYFPGQRNFTVVFQSAQGLGKSRWISKLIPIDDAWSEGAVCPDQKDSLALHADFVLFHLAELDSITTKSEQGALKNFLDTAQVTVRRPFDKFAKTFKSQLSFIASVNTDDFLRDVTGSRRFVVLPLAKINADHAVDMQQVFAQAKYLMDSGWESHLTKADEALCAEINSNFGNESVARDIFELLEVGVTDSDWLSASDVLNKLQNLPSRIRNLNVSDLRNLLAANFKSRQAGKSAKQFYVKIKDTFSGGTTC